MMYLGYNIKINDVEIPNEAILPGSYTTTSGRRIVQQWRDAYGNDHFQYYPGVKHSIAFTVKPRTKEENDIIRDLLRVRENIIMNYWDDETEAYVTGRFHIEDLSYIHSYDAADTVYYAELAVIFTEY